MKRASGILLHIASLPSPYGIGTLGKAAHAFADFLSRAGQSYWQLLPIGPTGYGDSPYQSFSAFAGSPYLIDPECLCEQGLLREQDCNAVCFSRENNAIAYDLLFENRLRLLYRAYRTGFARDEESVRAFSRAQAHWLPDYALFMALKDYFGGKAWLDWPDEDIRLHREGAVAHYRELLRDKVDFHSYLQYLFDQQWQALKAHCEQKGVALIGDIPMYVALDSADAWANRDCFLLDQTGRPTEVAGVPPDYFSATGQLWGNPLHDWDRMQADGYAWWKARIAGALRYFDGVRIDHFRALDTYYAIPYGEPTAQNGSWRIGPGMDFIHMLKATFPDAVFIAEDLGILTRSAQQLLIDSGYPGMRVLSFGFDGGADNPHLPYNYVKNCVVYTGTHDNNTIHGTYADFGEHQKRTAGCCLGLNEREGTAWGFVRGAMSSVADICIVPMQDYLELGAWARMNTPGTDAGNWCWRMEQGALTDALCARIAELTKVCGR